MLLMRDRLPVPAGLLPVPAPLPNLRDALQRRAAVFGPYDLDEAPAAPRGVLARCAAALRGVADSRFVMGIPIENQSTPQPPTIADLETCRRGNPR